MWTPARNKACKCNSANATMDFHGPGFGGTFVWEDDSNPFKTSLLIPEPSSALLGLLGVVFLLRRRR